MSVSCSKRRLFETVVFLFKLFLKIFFIYFLAAPGLSCGTQDLSLRRVGSLLQGAGFSLSSCDVRA